MHDIAHTVTLVLGGARSGKSRYAQRFAEDHWPRPVYLATAQALDSEMADRVRLHQSQRGPRWRTVEEPIEVARTIASPALDGDGILMDCVTIWLSNVLLQEGEDACTRRRTELLEALRARRNAVVLVSNEVGMGIVPESALGRTFRDLAGWLNQDLAAVADTVVFVAAGLPLVLKGRP